MSYTCMKCKGTFEETSHARACFAGGTPATIPTTTVLAGPAPVVTASGPHVTYKRATLPNTDRRASLKYTPKMIRLINDMAQERNATFQIPNNMLEASRLISELKKYPVIKAATPANPAAFVPEKFSCPRCESEFATEALAKMCPCPHTPAYVPFAKMMLDRIPDGRYGVANNEMTQTVFVRKRSVPATAVNKKMAGAVTIQVKSADNWIPAFTYWPSGKVSAYRKEWQGTDMNEILTLIFTDIGGSAQNYADKFSECSNCGKELTDDKSRYYGLGSDCIKRRLDIVNYVNSTKGPHTPGAATV